MIISHGKNTNLSSFLKILFWEGIFAVLLLVYFVLRLLVFDVAKQTSLTLSCIVILHK